MVWVKNFLSKFTSSLSIDPLEIHEHQIKNPCARKTDLYVQIQYKAAWSEMARLGRGWEFGLNKALCANKWMKINPGYEVLYEGSIILTLPFWHGKPSKNFLSRKVIMSYIGSGG